MTDNASAVFSTVEIDKASITKENKNINIQCSECRKRFDVSYDEISVCLPCEHLIHTKCLNAKCVSSNCSKVKCENISELYGLCKICNTKITKALTAVEIASTTENQIQYHQNYVDIMSITREKQTYSIWRKLVGATRVIRLLPTLGGFGTRVLFDHIGIPNRKSKWINIDYLLGINAKVIRIFNIHITVENIEKLVTESDEPIIILCNHTNFHDLFVMASIEPLPFLASPVINKFTLGRAITRTYPHLIVENDVTSKMTEHDKKKYEELDGGKKSGFEKIIDFLKSDDKLHKKLMICPEGMLTSANYITKFRSSAFKTGYKVRLAVIMYDENVFNHQNSDMLFVGKLNVKITITDPIETDGSIESIENIRKQMAQIGGFELSRVENRSLPKQDNVPK